MKITNIVSLPAKRGGSNLFKKIASSLSLLAMTHIVILFVPSVYADDWPQVQKDPQHTGYSNETLGTNFCRAWTYAFQPDRVHPQVQAIIYSGKVFVGTEGANGQAPSLYAFDAYSPDPKDSRRICDYYNPPNAYLLWKFTADGPMLNSVAADNNKVFFATLNGSVYALDMNGNPVWKKQLVDKRYGFSAAPIIAENKVFIGGRDGVFFALNAGDGSTIWSYKAGGPILQTAAYNNGKIFFGGQDMYVYALNTQDGTLAWKSAKIPGYAFKDYYPMVYQGKVLVRPMPNIYNGGNRRGGIDPGFPCAWNASCNWLSQWGPTIATGGATLVPDIVNLQNSVMADYQANPGAYVKSMYLFDEDTGVEAGSFPHGSGNTMHGGTATPCKDRDGYLVMPVFFITSGWGRVDLNQGRIVDILYDGTNAGRGNPDESMAVSCSANLVLAFHFMEGNANYTGAFNLDTRKWTNIMPGQRNKQMSQNTQGGGTNPASISNGLIYHISWHELIVRRAQ